VLDGPCLLVGVPWQAWRVGYSGLGLGVGGLCRVNCRPRLHCFDWRVLL